LSRRTCREPVGDRLHYWHEGDIILAGYARDSDYGWGVITERSGSKDALASVYAGREIAVAALGLFVVLSTTAGLVLSGRITRRFRSLSHAAHELSYGNFHAPLPRSSILEIDHLSAAFGEMRSELEKRNKEQEIIEKELLRSKEELEQRVFERTGELRDAVEALSNANKLLQIVLENAPAAIWIAGPNGELLQKNSMVDTVWGKGAPLSREIEEYAEYKGWWADTGEPVLPEEWAAARAVREGEPVIGQVIDILRFDGGTSTILNSASPIIDKDGNKLGAAVVSLDITAQRALEKQARQQAAELEKLLVENQRNRDLLEAIFLTDPGGLAVLAGEDLEFKLVNPAYRQLTPDPSLDIIGKKYDEVWPLQEGFQVKALIRQVLKSGESADSARHKRTYPNGAVRYFSLHLRYLNWENNPAVLSVLWETSSLEYAQRSAENAAEEAQARAVELAYEQARLRTILEHAPAGVVMADTSGSLIMVNRAADEMLGGKVSGDMYGPSVGYTLHHADGSRIESHDLPLPRALHGQEAVEGAEMVVYRENGTKNVLLVNAAPVLTGGEGIAGAVAIMQDITDRKRAEERMQFLMELSDFLSMSQAPEELVRGTAVRLENFYSLQTCALAEVNQEEDELTVYLGFPAQ
jgi:PAS domain S-box-containing protein